MTTLILGAGGFIGQAAAAGLQARGEAVLRARRTPMSDCILLDRTDRAAVVSMVRRHEVERIVDARAMTAEATAPLLNALEGEIGRYVLLSSSDVYAAYGAVHRLEPPPKTASLLTEDAPLRTRSFPYRGVVPRAEHDPERWMDDYDKLPIEAAVRASRLPSVVLRLPMVYGPGDRNRRFGWIAHRIAAGRTRIALDRRWAGWRTSYSYVEDVGDAIAAATLDPRAVGRTFNIGPQDWRDHMGWIRRLGAAVGRQMEGIAIAPDQLPDALRKPFDGLDLSVPLMIDSSALRTALGWSEPTVTKEALQRTYEDEIARGTPSSFQAALATEDALLQTLGL